MVIRKKPFSFDSFIRGYHGYMEIGTPEVRDAKAVVQRCYVKKVLLEMPQFTGKYLCKSQV